MEKRYWTSREELNQDPQTLEKLKREFLQDPFEEALNDADGTRTNRRDFLKLMGFGLTAATLAACQRAPVRYALPYVNKPVDMIVGEANYYASSFFDGNEYVATLIKTREGRPIFSEGNPLSGVTKGGSSARSTAHVLSLYDSYRAQRPRAEGIGNEWDKVDNFVRTNLRADSRVRILTGTVISPSTKAVIANFTQKFANTKHLQYDALSASGILDANEASFGRRVLPRYRFSQAEVIVGVNADFLGTWISPVEYTVEWAPGRKVTGGKRSMSRHIQLESNLTTTGASADLRVPIKPSHEGAIVLRLYNLVVKGQNAGGMDLPGNLLAGIAKELQAAQGKSLLVSGSNDVSIQVLVNAINSHLGNIGKTIDLDNHCLLRQGSDAEMAQLIADMDGGQVDAIFVYGCNPAYTHPQSAKFVEALKKVKLSVSLAVEPDETAEACKVHAPSHHMLESWGDAEPVAGKFSIQQPTIQPLFNTRQFESSLLTWLGLEADYYKFVKANWAGKFGAGANDADSWNRFLHDGVFERAEAETKAYEFKGNAEEAVGKLGAYGPGTQIDFMLYAKVVGAGEHAGNPWLQELPDPITKATWDNYLCVPVRMAQANGWRNGDVVNVKVGGLDANLPVLVVPGMHPEVVCAAVGYGRTKVGRAGLNEEGTGGRGQNVFPALRQEEGRYQFFTKNASLAKTEDTYELAITQTQGTVSTDARKETIVKERTLVDFAKNPNAIKEARAAMAEHMVNLYPDFVAKPGESIRWAMAIDLGACTGCGACVVACQAENNVSVVGKAQVALGREMHWIRIDRYYSSPETGLGGENLSAAEHPEEFPEVVFQPMLCQHCNNAPCEKVCPVLATLHSDEGLNQQVYNRCFGTRYCANNCPYKVRRFNWFDFTNKDVWIYNPIDDLSRMVLNPDVTVRCRGVMEKCSFCVQRLQEAKLTAKREGRPLKDGEATTACAKACPSNAIVFGNLNDANSQVSKLIAEGHTFYVVEEVKTLPNIGYLARIRNKRETDPKDINIA